MSERGKRELQVAEFLRLGIDGATAVLTALAGLATLGMMLLTVADLVSREYFHGSIPGTVELTEVALAASVYAGLASAERAGTHVRTPLATSRMPAKTAAVLRIVGHLVVLAFLVLIVWYSLQAGLASKARGEFRMGLAAIPIWPVKLFIPAAVALMALHVARRVYTDLRGTDDVSGTPLALPRATAEKAELLAEEGL